jgi:hypothetical protein
MLLRMPVSQKRHKSELIGRRPFMGQYALTLNGFRRVV